VLETECVATGAARCAFEAREPAAFGERDSARARALLERVPMAALRGAALAPEAAAHALPSQRDLPAGSTLVDVWGPVMVLPFVDPDDALRLVEAVRRDPGTREVRVVVIDLRGQPLDEAFGAAALESVLECLGQWGAEAVLTGVSPLADAAVRELEERHLVVRKDAAEAIATAFQIAAAQRRAW
jgi:hypothetical protein